MSDQFFDVLGLVSKDKHYHVAKHRPLTLQINLKPEQPRESVPWTPKTPCSMLSPLTPKFRKPDWPSNKTITPDITPSLTERTSNLDFEDDPSLALMMVDLTSNLGKRISNNLAMLISSPPYKTTTNYDQYCNRGQPPVDPNLRQLRSLEGRIQPVYRKRHCHRCIDRMYYFKSSEKKERSRTLQTGLNKASRKLLRKMKPCRTLLTKVDVDDAIHPDSSLLDDPVLRLLSSAAVPVLCLSRINKDLQHTSGSYSKTQEFSDGQRNKQATDQNAASIPMVDAPTPMASRKPVSFIAYPSHRKSLRRRKIPRRLLHVM